MGVLAGRKELRERRTRIVHRLLGLALLVAAEPIGYAPLGNEKELPGGNGLILVLDRFHYWRLYSL